MKIPPSSTRCKVPSGDTCPHRSPTSRAAFDPNISLIIDRLVFCEEALQGAHQTIDTYHSMVETQLATMASQLATMKDQTATIERFTAALEQSTQARHEAFLIQLITTQDGEVGL